MAHALHAYAPYHEMVQVYLRLRVLRNAKTSRAFCTRERVQAKVRHRALAFQFLFRKNTPYIFGEFRGRFARFIFLSEPEFFGRNQLLQERESYH